MILARPLTVDANVFTAAARPAEPHFTQSRAMVIELRRRAIEIVCPTLTISELIAAIARATGDCPLALRVARQFSRLPGLSLIALDEPLSWVAGQLAATNRLRGADAVYLAVAQQSNTTLVTWDNEMLQRSGKVVPTLTPTDWLASQTA
jgi:predicted nucleic acid-binding protein